MKKFTLVLCAFLVMTVLSSACVSAESPAPQNPLIRLSTTTSVNDSGLLPILQSEFEADTGYKLEIISTGTGAAI